MAEQVNECLVSVSNQTKRRMRWHLAYLHQAATQPGGLDSVPPGSRLMANHMVKKRCTWVGDGNPLMLEYHDREWGVPVHDDRRHFEFLLLEGAQAGLSWSTILKKREGYRRAFGD